MHLTNTASRVFELTKSEQRTIGHILIRINPTVNLIFFFAKLFVYFLRTSVLLKTCLVVLAGGSLRRIRHQSQVSPRLTGKPFLDQKCLISKYESSVLCPFASPPVFLFVVANYLGCTQTDMLHFVLAQSACFLL